MAKRKPKQKVVRCVAYLRISRKGKKVDKYGQEKSIKDQRKRIAALQPTEPNTKYEIVRWYEKDEGIPGWKRGAKRPDYHRLVEELPETKATCILVDDMDRFSRANEMEALHDVQVLKERHGIRLIVAVNQGNFDLVNDSFAAMKIALAAMASHEYSTRLSRRITEARKDAAENKRRRSGGNAPYGYVTCHKPGTKPGPDDKPTHLKPGDRKHVRVVQDIFKWFAEDYMSLTWVAGELNRKGIPSPKGKKWSVVGIKQLLRRRVYKGDLVYNQKKSGEFHYINGDYKVVPISKYHEDKPKAWKQTPEGVIEWKGVYKPLVDSKLFDAAQRRLDMLAKRGGRRPRAKGFVLSRLIKCAKCGGYMNGVTFRGKRIYRCNTNSMKGQGACEYYWVAEDLLLPKVLMEIKKPEETIVRQPKQDKQQADEEQAEIEQRCQELEQRIQEAEARLNSKDTDARRKTFINKTIEQDLDELDKLRANKAPEIEEQDKRAVIDAALKRVQAWARESAKTDYLMPITQKVCDELIQRTGAYDPDGTWSSWVESFIEYDKDGGPLLRVNVRRLNELLHDWGTEITLRWRTTGSGRQRRHKPLPGTIVIKGLGVKKAF